MSGTHWRSGHGGSTGGAGERECQAFAGISDRVIVDDDADVFARLTRIEGKRCDRHERIGGLSAEHKPARGGGREVDGGFGVERRAEHHEHIRLASAFGERGTGVDESDRRCGGGDASAAGLNAAVGSDRDDGRGTGRDAVEIGLTDGGTLTAPDAVCFRLGDDGAMLTDGNAATAHAADAVQGRGTAGGKLSLQIGACPEVAISGSADAEVAIRREETFIMAAGNVCDALEVNASQAAAAVGPGDTIGGSENFRLTGSAIKRAAADRNEIRTQRQRDHEKGGADGRYEDSVGVGDALQRMTRGDGAASPGEAVFRGEDDAAT